MSRFSRAVRGALNPLFGLVGLHVESAREFRQRVKDDPGPALRPSLRSGLERLRARGLGVRTLIDVGAAVGKWSRLYAKVLGRPEHLVLVEANSVHREGLERFVADFPGAHVVHAAAGPEVGETWFETSIPLGGGARRERGETGRWVKVPATTLDREVAARGLPGPYLLKLDTHGFEEPILAGAREVLAATAALVVECYNFDVAETAQRFPEFCRTMEARGFRCVDAWDLMYRPRDGALWQLDLLFVRADRPEFTASGARTFEDPPAPGAASAPPKGRG
jgi:FkbM family methyltransferase